jgi:tetratricopeptide (TPR) repeat protein
MLQLGELYVRLGFLPEASKVVSTLEKNLPPDVEASGRSDLLGYYQLRVLVAAASGDYEKTAALLAVRDALLVRMAADEALAGLRMQTLGGHSQLPGNFLAGAHSLRRGQEIVAQHAQNLSLLGLVALEVGRPSEAAALFRRALAADRETRYRPLIGHYYRQITGRWLAPEGP